MNEDLTVKLRLKADGSGFVGEVSRAGNVVDTLGKKTNKSKKALTAFERQTIETERAIKMLTASGKGVVGFFTSIRGLIATAGMGLVSKQFLNAASTSEQYEIRLKHLLGTQEEGNRLFRDMAFYAGKVPFQYEEIMGAATQLSGIMEGGVDEINQWMPIISDLAAVSGLSIEQTTQQVVRMYSAGAASADLFRERGISSMLGFKGGVTYTAEETRKQLVAEWEKVDSKFRGTTGDLADSWSGLMSMYGDSWFRMRTDIMGDGLFDELKAEAKDVLGSVNEWQDADGALELADDVRLLSSAFLTLGKIVAVGGGIYLGVAAMPLAMTAGALAATFMAKNIAALSIAAAGGVSPITMMNASLYGTSISASLAAGSLTKLKLAGSLLFAAFAGWEIGSYLREEFVEARIAGLTFVSMTLKGWEHLKYGADVAMAGIDTAWDSMLSGMKEGFSWLIDKAATAADFLGFDDKAKSLRSYSNTLKAGAGETETFAQAMSRLSEEHSQNINNIDKTIVSMVAYELALDRTTKAEERAIKAKLTKKAVTSPEQKNMLSEQWNAEDNSEVAKQARDEAKSLEKQITDLTLSTDNFGEAWVRTGNKMLDAMASVGQVLEKNHNQELAYAEDKKKINALQALHVDVNGERSEQLSLKLTELENQRTQSSLKGSLAMLDASVGMFKEGSDAQRIAHGLSLTIHATEMAMNIQKAISNASYTTTKLASDQVLAVSSATLAVAEQGQGDPYTAWPRIAAMSAMMAGLLSQMGTNFNGASGGTVTAGGYQDQTAGVLGGDGTSAAITNTTDYMEELQAGQYDELKQLNTSMNSLNSNITGLVKNLYYGGDLKSIGTNLIDYDSRDSRGGIENAIISVFGGARTSNTVDYGLKISDFDLGNSANVAGYKRDKHTKDGGWFRSDKTWYTESGVNVTDKTQDYFNSVFSDLNTSAKEVAEQLGLSADKQIDDFNVSIGKISTAGKSAEEIAQEITGKISAVSDELATEIFGTYTQIYQQLNESAFETASRLAVDKTVVGDLLTQTGQQFVSDAVHASQALIALSGGLDVLQDNVATYYDKFYTEEEKAQRNFEELTRSLSDVDQVLPTTRDSYRQLVEGLNLATAAGQEQYATLLELSGAADDYYKTLEQSQQKAFDTQIALYDNLNSALSNTFDSIIKSVIPDSMQYMNAQATVAGALSDAKNGDIPGLDELKDSLSVLGRNNENNYATFADYQRDQIATANMLDELSSYVDTGISVEENMLSELQKQTSILSGVELNTLNTELQLVTAVNDNFGQVDINLDGLIDYTEFAKNFEGLATNAELQGYFNNLDIDATGTISKLESIAKQTLLLATLEEQKTQTDVFNESDYKIIYVDGERLIQYEDGSTQIDYKKTIMPVLEGAGSSKIDGSHFNGIVSIPYDGYIAETHHKEMIAPAPVVSFLQSAGIQVGGGNNLNVLESDIKALINEVKKGNDKAQQLLITIASSSIQQGNIVRKHDKSGTPPVRESL